MQKFCPRCGAETEGLGSRGLCENCYVEENELLAVPDEIAVTVCSICGSVKVGPEWKEVEGDRELIYEVLNHHIEGENVVAVSYDKDDEDYEVKILAEKSIDGQPLQEEITTRLNVTKDQCELCAKFHGGYYTYKLQIRGNVSEEALDAVMERAAEVTNKNREHFVSDVKTSKHGYDLYISTRTMAEELLKELEAQYEITKQRSKELVGQQEGQEVYRTVISARIEG